MKRTSPLAIAVVVALLAADGALAQGFGSGPVSLPVPVAPVLGGLAFALALTWRHVAARRGSLALGGAALAFALGAPAYAAGALALLVLCVQRREHAAGAVVAGAAVVASTLSAVSAQLAAVDVSLTVAALPFFGVTPLVEGRAMSLGAGVATVDPACAAVEGAAVAFVLSVCVRSLVGQSQRRVLALALAHTAAFLSVT